MGNRPRLTHETAVHVFRFLAEFAQAYPTLCEGEQRMYRDLTRAALLCIDDEQRAETQLLKRGVDEILFRACREDVGAYLVRQLRRDGFRVTLTEQAQLTVGPREKLTPGLVERIKRWSQAIRDALLAEGLNEQAVINGTQAKT